MARKGRARWSNRPLVEACLTFDLGDLVRAGVFRAKVGTLSRSDWKDPNGLAIFCAYHYLELTPSKTMLLHVSYGPPSNVPLMHYAKTETIEIVETPLHFGPRRWFLCPGTHNNAPCRRRARILHFSPDLHRLGCRRCLDLIHRSAREHDARIDAILRLPLEDFQKILHQDTLRLGSLAVRVGRVLQRQLEGKAAKPAGGQAGG